MEGECFTVKIGIILVLGLLPFMPLACKAQSAARPLSLQETIAWMENYSQSHGMYITPVNVIYNRIESLGGCEVRFSMNHPTSSPTEIKSMFAKVSLTVFDPKSVNQINDAAGAHIVTIERTDGAMKTYADVQWGDGRKTSQLSPMEALFFNSEEATQRFAKALSYAIAECGASSASF